MDIPIKTGIKVQQLEPPEYPAFYGIVLPIIAFLGITGNIICALVFHAKHMRSSATTYLTALAFADSMYLLCACLFYSPRPLTWLSTDRDPDFQYPYPELFVRSEPLIDVAEVLTIMYTLSAAFDQHTFVFKAKKYIRWTQVDTAQNIVIITLGVVLLLHIMNFFKLQVVVVDLPGLSVSKVCTSAFYMHETVQIWDRYVYFVVFGWLPLLLLLIVVLNLCYQSWRWKRKDYIDLPDRFFKDGRSNKTIITLGFVAILCLVPDHILQSMMLGNIKSYESLPICVHRAMRLSRAAFDTNKWELLVVVFAVINASLKFVLYMIFSNQFRWTVLYCLHKPFKKHESQPPTKNMFAENFVNRILQRSSTNFNSESYSPPQRPSGGGGSGGYYRNYNTQQPPTSSNQYYHGNSNNPAQRPYVIAGSNVPMTPPEYPQNDDVRYYEDQYGSRKMVVNPSGAAGQPLHVPHPSHVKNNNIYPSEPRSNHPMRRDLPPSRPPSHHPHSQYHHPQARRVTGSTPGSQESKQEPRLKWREERLEPFPRTNQQGIRISGGPWDDDVMEMRI